MTPTAVSSSAVGAMLNSRKYSMTSMLFVPRSMVLVTSPVRRDRWNLSDS